MYFFISATNMDFYLESKNNIRMFIVKLQFIR